jgi:hypothetical protein
MSSPSSFLDLAGQVFRPTHRGVAGLVNDLLELCPEQGLELDWRADHCRVCCLGVEPEEAIEVPLPKSVFRAVLARLATLCNERNPGSVSPYGGEGALMVGVDPATVCRVAFTNTSSAQRVRLTRIQQDNQVDEQQRPQQSGLDSDPRLRASAAR